MNTPLSIEDVKLFTPFQHSLRYAERLEKVEQFHNEIFSTQAENVRLILSKNLDNNEMKRISKLTKLPEETLNNAFNTVAQREMEKSIYALRSKSFSRSMDSVDVPEP